VVKAALQYSRGWSSSFFGWGETCGATKLCNEQLDRSFSKERYI